jgi:hypothetical protein
MTAEKGPKNDRLAVFGDPPTTTRRYRCKLDSLGDIRREMGRIYREARSEKLPTGEASRLVFMLASIGRIIADSDLERRIQQLEERQL